MQWDKSITEEIGNPISRAATRFKNGYSCSQSILIAFGPQLGLREEIAAKVASPFGGGIGRDGKTCGTVIGALMVIGLKYGHEMNSTKEKVYRISKDFLDRFRIEFESTQCRNLINYDISDAREHQAARDANVFKTICPGLVDRTAEILIDLLESSPG